MTHLQQYLLMLEHAGIKYSLRDSDTFLTRRVIVEPGSSGLRAQHTFDYAGELVHVDTCNA